MNAKIKGKVYGTCVRPALMYGLETIPLTKAAESKMEVVEMRMLRFSLGLTRINRVPNAEVRKQLQTRRFGDKLRERLRWFGHVKRRPEDYVGRKMMEMTPPGKSRRGRPKRRFMDAVKEDMKIVGMLEDTANRNKAFVLPSTHANYRSRNPRYAEVLIPNFLRRNLGYFIPKSSGILCRSVYRLSLCYSFQSSLVDIEK
ncbi:uncharacterized protein LOC134766047 [Penaeus indicus]|uniref:uncharacterized protein LOC134766047 n=1 Tax=Penaeus indicus TaxID=29960 RepID=UPI00300CA335